jgi:hypothetical protein
MASFKLNDSGGSAQVGEELFRLDVSWYPLVYKNEGRFPGSRAHGTVPKGRPSQLRRGRILMIVRFGLLTRVYFENSGKVIGTRIQSR